MACKIVTNVVVYFLVLTISLSSITTINGTAFAFKVGSSGIVPIDTPYTGTLKVLAKHLGSPIHQDITKLALPFLKDDVIKRINTGHEFSDIVGENQDDTSFHVDSCNFDGATVHIQVKYDEVLNLLKSKDPKSLVDIKTGDGRGAFEKFGEILHTSQDFYAHSNWVELFNKGYIPADHKLIDSGLGKWHILTKNQDIVGTNVRVIKGTDSDADLTRSNNGHIISIKSAPGKGGLISGVATTSFCPPNIALGHWDPYFVFYNLRPFSSERRLVEVDIGTVVSKLLLPGELQTPIPGIKSGVSQFPSIDSGLNKDDPSRPDHGQAKKFAFDQTVHEWCRLINLVKTSDGPDGVKFLIKNWAADPDASLRACNIKRPVADAGTDQIIDTNAQSNIFLDGSKSKNVQGAEMLTYSWKQIGGPAVPFITSDPHSAGWTVDISTLKTTHFTGTLVFQLTVNDGIFDSFPDTITVQLVDGSIPPQTFIVDSESTPTPGDCTPGHPCTFDKALDMANDQRGKNIIKFSRSMKLSTCFGYTINDPVTIDATINGKPGVEITCGNPNYWFNGLDILAGGTTIKGLAINGFRQAIFIGDKDGNTIQGNYLGLSKDGGLDVFQNKFGIAITSSGNYIGGPILGEGNVISNNLKQGVIIISLTEGSVSSGNVLQGNYIGTSKSGEGFGLPDIGNTDPESLQRQNIGANFDTGIEIVNSPGNLIGGISSLDSQGNMKCLGACNIISGNGKVSDTGSTGSGIKIYGQESKNNVIQGNFIGTDIQGNAYGNIHNGLAIYDNDFWGKPSDNLIGGIELGSGNLISGNRLSGITLQGTSGNSVQGNYIGTDEQGLSPASNGLNGLQIVGSTHTLVGGDSSAARNVISNNLHDGIIIASLSEEKSSENTILGNYIGVDKSGSKSLANIGSGMVIANSPSNIIGGSLGVSDTENICQSACNLISGNFENAISVFGKLSTGNTIASNFVGLSVDGKSVLPNGDGIVIGKGTLNSDEVGTASTTVITSNVISGNKVDGIHLFGSTNNSLSGNLIGVDSTGNGQLGNGRNAISIVDSSNNFVSSGNVIANSGLNGVSISGKSFGNTIRENSIYMNTQLGIDLGFESGVDGVTPNDNLNVNSLDVDEGPNQLMNSPAGVSAQWDPSSDKTVITGILSTTNPETSIVDIYSNEVAKRSAGGSSTTNFGEGKTYLGSSVPSEDGKFRFVYDGRLISKIVSATATAVDGSTSEFSSVCGDPDKNGNVDNDEDGICDDWELTGIDFDGNGFPDSNLYSAAEINKHLNHKDIFVEIDYMEHHRPRDDALGAVIDSFGNSPVENPDGSNGVNLLISMDDEIPHVNTISYQDFQDIKLQFFGSKTQRDSSNAYNALQADGLVYRYGLFAHQRSDSASDVLGQADIGSENMLFTFGAANCGVDVFCKDINGHVIGTSSRQAITFMHELGHTLGLEHGGGDPENCKPNYLSVMNYAYMIMGDTWLQKQYTAITDISNTVKVLDIPYGAIDFSRAKLADLDENTLQENEGVQLYGTKSPPGFDTMYVAHTNDPSGSSHVQYKIAGTGEPIDWDDDGTMEGASADINNFDSKFGKINDCTENKRSSLAGFNDWEALKYNFRHTVFSSLGFAKAHEISDPTNSEIEAVQSVIADSIPYVNTSISSKKDGFNRALLSDQGTDSAIARFEFTGTTALNNSHITSFWCSRDGSAFSICKSPQQYTNLEFGQHSFRVRALDSLNNTDITPASFNWNVTNHLPIVRAGVDQPVNETHKVILNGSAADAEDGPQGLTYKWTQISGSSNVTLQGSDLTTASFSAPSVNSTGGTFKFRLTVFDKNNGTASDAVSIVVNNINHNPIATISPATQTVNEGSGVTLDGRESFDPDNDAIIYSWKQILGPYVKLNSTSSETIRFDAPTNAPIGESLFEEVQFELKVTDVNGAENSTTATIIVKNVFNAHESQEGYIYVDQWGSGQFDPLDPDDFSSLGPKGFDLDPLNKIFYVVDFSNDAIKKFTINGTLLTTWAVSPSPHEVAVDPTGQIVYVTDHLFGFVHRYSTAGTPMGSWKVVNPDNPENTGFGTSDGIAVDPTGNFVYACSHGWIIKYTSIGHFVTQWRSECGSTTVKSGGIAVDSDGNVYTGTRSLIKKFDANGTFIKNIGDIFLLPLHYDSVDLDGKKNVYSVGDGVIRKYTSDGARVTPLFPRFDEAACENNPDDIRFESNNDISVLPDGNTVYVLVAGEKDCIKRFIRDQLPVAFDQSVHTPSGIPVNITLNGMDLDNDTLTFREESQFYLGTISNFDANQGTLTYTPSSNFTSYIENFVFKVTDGKASSPENGVIRIFVGDSAPVALDQNVSTFKNMPYNITLKGIRSDSNDTSGLTFTIVKHPSHGNLIEFSSVPGYNPHQNLTYKPETNFSGQDSFTFRVSDGVQFSRNNATVNIGVRGENKSPIANAGPDLRVKENTTGVVLNGSASHDFDGGKINSYAWKQIAGHTVSLQGNASKVAMFDAPSVSNNSLLKFNLTVTDNENTTAFDLVNVLITNVNVPPTAKAGEDITVNEGIDGVQLNGSGSFDPDSKNIVKYIWKQIQGPTVLSTSPNTPLLTFKAPGVSLDTLLLFNLTVQDGDGAFSSPDTILVNIKNINNPPSTSPVSVRTDRNIPVNITLHGSDPDPDKLVLKILTSPAHGVISRLQSPLFFSADLKPPISVPAPIIPHGKASFVYNTTTRILSYSINLTNSSSLVEAETNIRIGNETTIGPVIFSLPLGSSKSGSVGPLNSGQQSQLSDETIYLVTKFQQGDEINGKIEFAGNLLDKMTYVPESNFTGFDSFNFRVFDGLEYSNISSVDLQIHPLPIIPVLVNHPPIAEDQKVSTPINKTLAINLVSTDIDKGPLTISNLGVPNFGSLSEPRVVTHFEAQLNGSQETPATASIASAKADFVFNETSKVLSYSIQYTGINLPDSEIHIHVGERGKGGGSLEYTLPIGSELSGTLGPLSIQQQQKLNSGELYINIHTFDYPFGAIRGQIEPQGFLEASLDYSPAPNHVGLDSFTYKSSDGKIESNTGTVLINVNGTNAINTPPIARDDLANTDEDKQVLIPILSNDTDVDGDDLVINSVELQPTKGSTVINPNGTITYSPNTNFFGSDGFNYAISDGKGGNATAHVSVTVNSVNDPPLAISDTAFTLEGKPVVINVLGNDTDPEGDALVISGITNPPSNGTAIINNNGTITFSVPTGFSGSDTFDYQVSDGNGGNSTASVLVNVIAAVNRPPVVSISSPVNGSQFTKGDQVVFSGSATDPEDGNISSVMIWESSIDGPLGIGPNIVASSLSQGTHSITASAIDSGQLSNSSRIEIIVNDFNEAPIAIADHFNTNEDTPLNMNVISNDTDPENDALTITAINQSSNDGQANINNNNTINYSPNQNFNGQDSLTYTITDGLGGNSSAQVIVDVLPVNDDPIAKNDSSATDKNTAALVDVLANDTDVDNDPLTISQVTKPTHGTASIESGKIKYTASLNFVGLDEFDYTVSDGNGGNSQASVTVNVMSVNQLPVAIDGSVNTDENSPLNMKLNASDPDNDPLTYILNTQPIHGSITGFDDSNGTLTYTPPSNFTGQDSLKFKVNDGTADSNVATVLINVNNVNHSPLAQNQNVATNTNKQIEITLKGHDPDSDLITFVKVTDPPHGTIAGFDKDTGKLTYIPSNGYSGPDSFLFKVIDSNKAESNIATVTILVNAVVNMPPVASNVNVETSQDTAKVITLVGTDPDAGDKITYHIVSAASSGSTSSIDQITGKVTYTPNKGFLGPDSFTYKVTDLSGADSNIAAVGITVKSTSPTPYPLPPSCSPNDKSGGKALRGTNSDDVIVGTEAADSIQGLSGNDAINGCGASDNLNGNAGNDGIAGGTNEDNIHGNNGNDYLRGDAGNDGLYGGEGDDVLVGGPGRDSFYCGSGNDKVLDFNAKEGDALQKQSNTKGRDGTQKSDCENVSSISSTSTSTKSSSQAVPPTPTEKISPRDNRNQSQPISTQSEQSTQKRQNDTNQISQNSQPVVTDYTLSIDKNQRVSIILPGDDKDGDKLLFKIINKPQNGLIGNFEASSGSLTYTSSKDYVGDDKFTFTANDGKTDSNTGTVIIHVKDKQIIVDQQTESQSSGNPVKPFPLIYWRGNMDKTEKLLPLSVGNLTVESADQVTKVLRISSDNRNIYDNVAAQILTAKFNIKNDVNSCKKVNEVINYGDEILHSVNYQGAGTATQELSAPQMKNMIKGYSILTQFNIQGCTTISPTDITFVPNIFEILYADLVSLFVN